MWHTWRLPSLKIMSLFGSWVHWSSLWLMWITTLNITALVLLFAILLPTVLPQGHLCQSFEELQMASAGPLFIPGGARGVVWGHSKLAELGWVPVWAAGPNTCQVMCTLLTPFRALASLCSSIYTEFLGGKGRTKINNMQVKILLVVLQVYSNPNVALTAFGCFPCVTGWREKACFEWLVFHNRIELGKASLTLSHSGLCCPN